MFDDFIKPRTQICNAISIPFGISRFKTVNQRLSDLIHGDSGGIGKELKFDNGLF